MNNKSIKDYNLDEIKYKLSLDELNTTYFQTLVSRKKNQKKQESLVIFDKNEVNSSDINYAYPTASADKDMMKHLPYSSYKNLLKDKKELEQLSREASLWYRPMQAGTGSSIERTNYLASLKQCPKEEVQIGSKGTDLYTSILYQGEKYFLSLAELQILRSLLDAQKGLFQEIIFHDIVGTETQKSIDLIWNKESIPNRAKTYKELVQELSCVQNFGKTFQSHLPTFNEEGEISFNRMAPGGHALFGLDALIAAYREEQRPKSLGPLIGVIGNGEDLSSMPDSLMIGHMLKNKIPIIMVTTEKTSIDLKGGQIALLKGKDGQIAATIIEKAQAQESKQLKLFEELGLREGDSMAFFNTNMALFNYEALSPLISKLVYEIGEQEFLSLIAPNLIENWKEQVDSDGIKRKYLQLEGAMGSVLLNLDQYHRRKYGKPIVHFINVEKEFRTHFFSPIKTAFDYFMQFHSDCFEFNPETLRLIHKKPGFLPDITLEHKYYNSVDNVLSAFENCSILDLDSLKISGQVKLPNFILKGTLIIENRFSHCIDLNSYPELKNKLLINSKLTIDEEGLVSLFSL